MAHSTTIEEKNSEDQTLFCTECDEEFQFGLGDLIFSQLQGLNNIPKRCPVCEERWLKVS